MDDKDRGFVSAGIANLIAIFNGVLSLGHCISIFIQHHIIDSASVAEQRLVVFVTPLGTS